MNLKELTIEGYKSIGKITISNPNPFTVFVGPNASGKSNIFEAIELLALCSVIKPSDAIKLFGSSDDLFNQSNALNELNEPTYIDVKAMFEGSSSNQVVTDLFIRNESPIFVIAENKEIVPTQDGWSIGRSNTYHDNLLGGETLEFRQFVNFTRLFVGQPSRLRKIDDSRMSTYEYKQSNLEKALKRILKDENKREEIYEILQLLIPGFERVEITSSELSGRDDMLIYEAHLKKPLTKEFISDGTFNIISILAALYQSDEPQFLCIEEPENGINPFVVKELVNIIRDICEEKGHYVWLNTHSQSLVSVLTKEEIIIVEKKNGLTEIKQIPDMNLHGLRMDDALYTNSIGGGNPW